MSTQHEDKIDLDQLCNDIKALTCAAHPAGYTAKEARMFNLGFYAGTTMAYEKAVAQLALARKAQEPAIPEGWALVPIEPTDEMIVAFAEEWYSRKQAIDDPDMVAAYSAMLAAAKETTHV